MVLMLMLKMIMEVVLYLLASANGHKDIVEIGQLEMVLMLMLKITTDISFTSQVMDVKTGTTNQNGANVYVKN